MKIYSFNDFVIDDFQSKESGTYGEIINVTFGNEKMVLKKYINYNKYDLINQDIFAELLLLQKLNMYTTYCEKLYGLCFDEGLIYLVLEKLEKNLLQYSKDERNNNFNTDQYKNVFLQLCEALYNVHSLGILHNDFKCQNIMVDSNENIKLIDFGLSCFIGFGPIHDIVDKYLTTANIMAPNNPKSNRFSKTSKKTYATDMYSLACTMIHFILKKYYTIVLENNEILIENDDKSMSNISNFIKNKIGGNGFDLLTKLLNNDTRNRLSAKEALTHIYFKEQKAGASAEKEKEKEKDSISNTNSIKNNKSFDYIEYTSDDYNKKKYELQYLEEIHENYKNDIINININKNNVNSYLDLFYNEVIIGIDTFINGISKDNYEYTGIYMYSSIFNESVSYYKAKYLASNLKEVIIDYSDSLNFTPISIHIYYIWIKLKYELQADIDKKFLINMCIFALYFFTRPLQYSDNIKIWNVAVFIALKLLVKMKIYIKIDWLKLPKDEYHKLNDYFKKEFPKTHSGSGYEYLQELMNDIFLEK